MTTNRFQLSQEEAQRLLAKAPDAEERLGFVCDADPRDHLHVGRIGDQGSGLEARGTLLIHEGGRAARVFMAAPRLRVLAAALLDVADEIDGMTPLTFFPPEVPEVEEPDEFAKTFFVADNGDGVPALWRHRPERPSAPQEITTRDEIDPDVWAVLAERAGTYDDDEENHE